MQPMLELLLIGGLVVSLTAWYVVTRNGLITARNQVDEAWSGIDVQLKRRHDLVPNLISTVRGYAAHEQSTLDRVVAARAAAMGAAPGQDRAAAESELSGALGRVHVVAEQYPQLRASENFQALQRELAEIEDQLQAARRIFNGNVRVYNTRIQVFPGSVVAGRTFRPRGYFELESPAERAVPAVAV